MSYHDPEEINEALAVLGLRLVTWQSVPTNETILEYYDDEVDEHQQVAQFGIRLLQGGGLEATRFWIHDDYQGRGIYTMCHKWALTQPFCVISGSPDEQTKEFFKRSGYIEAESGLLSMHEESTKAWLEER